MSNYDLSYSNFKKRAFHNENMRKKLNINDDIHESDFDMIVYRSHLAQWISLTDEQRSAIGTKLSRLTNQI